MHLAAPLALAAAAALASCRAAAVSPEPLGFAALLSGVGLAYLVDRLRDASASSGRGHLIDRARPLLWGTAAALALVLLATAIASPRHVPLLAVLSLLALCYPVLARIPGGKSGALVGAWVLGCTRLPLPATAAPPAAWIAGFALLVAAAGVLCDIKDAARDRSTGVVSAVTALGPRGARVLAAGLAVASLLPGLLHGGAGARTPIAASVGLVVLAALPRLLEREMEGPMAVDLALAAALAFGR